MSKKTCDTERKVTWVRKKNTSSHNNSHENSSFEDINNVDYNLMISIHNKLDKLPEMLNDSKVTIGPTAVNDCVFEKKHDKIKNSARLNETMSPRSNSTTFSVKKILWENEYQRKESVKKVVDKKKKEMERNAKICQDELSMRLAKMTVQKEKESAEELAQLEAKEEQLAAQSEIDRKNKIEQQRLQESAEMMRKIIPFQERFRARLKDIATVTKNCRDRASASILLNSRTASLNQLNIQMEAINAKAKTGDLTSTDVEMAKILAQCNEEIFQMFKNDLEQIDNLFEQELARREMELKKAELEIQKEALQQLEQQNALKIQQQVELDQSIQRQQESQVDGKISEQPPQYSSEPVSIETNSNSIETVTSGSETESEYPDLESLQIYLESQKFLKEYEMKFDEFVKSDCMKKMKFECQKALNITINAISQSSRQQLVDKYNKLSLFLSGKSSPNILLNPQAEAFSKNLLAKKIVEQGETSISSQPELAFPFAAVAVAIWNDWPDVGALLLAHFHNMSSFFVPVFLVARPDQSDEDYHKLLGYKYNKNGVLEDSEKYWKRLKGMMYLYASILITKQRQGVDKPHPHGIGNAWRWLAATLNMEPRDDTADVCATLINIILEVTGHDLGKTYPNQFPKMLQILDKVYYPKLKALKVSGPVTRLGDFLSTALEKKFIPPPAKQLPANFW